MMLVVVGGGVVFTPYSHSQVYRLTSADGQRIL